MSASDATFSIQAYKTNVLILASVHDFVDESRRPSWAELFNENREIYKNEKIEEIESLFNII